MTNNPMKRLKIDECHYENIVNHMLDLACVTDLENIICFANQAFSKVLGYSPKQLVGLSVFEFVHPDDHTIVKNAFKDVNTLAYKKIGQFRVIHADGSIVWLDGIKTSIFDENGKITGYISVNRDITEKKAIDQQLQLAANVFKYSIEGIMVTDLNGSIQMVNTSFENITGYTAEEVIGKDSRILKSGIHTADFYGALWKTIKLEGKWQGEIINRRKDGKLYYQRTTIATIKGEDDNPISYCSIFSDVTEAKEAERKLISDLELARQLQKSVLSRPIKNDLINIDGVYRPSSQLAGDMYVWYEIEKSKYGVILLDIMGHGIASSLVSMAIRSLLRGIITKSANPENVLADLNIHMRYLFRQNEISLSYFFTAIYVVIDLDKKVIEYASAGHPPGLLIKEDQTVHNLDLGCAPIGMLPELIIETGVIPIEGRNQIILYTDGLLDSFGVYTSQNIEKLKELVVSFGADLDSSQILEAVLNQVSITNKRFSDDVAMVAITIP